ncbi:MAG TPA: hypothetical protein VFG52_03470 [Xanthomonadales bacterium]|nr:hypothetical protein [Xanthomonadales bacterium]
MMPGIHAIGFNMARVVFVLALLIFTVQVQSQEPLVRASVSGKHASSDQLWVGQGVTLVVEVLVPGYFNSAVHFNLPDPAGVLLMPPQDHPLVSNEAIDGTEYTVQRLELRAWPMRAGDVNIPAFTASFSYKQNPLDEQGKPGTVTTPALQLSVQTPPGAENLGLVISARNLRVKESWQPEPGDDPVKAGSVYTRTIAWSAPDVPGLLFPPFPAGEVDGMGIYSKQNLQDRDERGVFTGERRDEISYVFQRPGQFTVPATQFTWFDLDSQQLRTESFAAQTFNVIVNPDMASGQAGTATGQPPKRGMAWQILLLMVVLASLVLASFSPRGRQQWHRLIAPFRPVHLEPLNPRGRDNS